MSGRVRRGGRRYRLADHLLIAGIAGGFVYLALLYLVHAPAPVAWPVGVLGAGVVFGRIARLPHVRSPLVCRRTSR